MSDATELIAAIRKIIARVHTNEDRMGDRVTIGPYGALEAIESECANYEEDRIVDAELAEYDEMKG